MSDQSWLRDRIFRDPEFRLPGSGSKNPEEIPSAKSRKSQHSGDKDRDLKIPRKIRKSGHWDFLFLGFFESADFFLDNGIFSPKVLAKFPE